MLQNILKHFGLESDKYKIEPFGSGLINSTWKVSGSEGKFILQRINKNVFKEPQIIASNLDKLKTFLKHQSPDYLFVAPLLTADGKNLINVEGEYFRLMPFIDKSHTVDFITDPRQGFEAASQFGRFTFLLNDFDTHQLKDTLPDFHNLTLRFEQFNEALQTAPEDRLNEAKEDIKQINDNADIVEIYTQLNNNKQIPLRVTHHDTKINNVLFDEYEKGLCVIDLDTVMSGYFISDVGDMMRTYLSEANEEETDFDKISIRKDFFLAIFDGYMKEMGSVLTSVEKSLFFYSGKFMIYMQAIRFITDYLNGDIYYHTQYPAHNLMRGRNQLKLLNEYIASAEVMNFTTISEH